MNRLITVAVLVLLVAGLVGGAIITRYRYYDVQGVPLFRIDRWTGVRERWDCRAFKTDDSGKILREWTDADEPSTTSGFKIPPEYSGKRTVCSWGAD